MLLGEVPPDLGVAAPHDGAVPTPHRAPAAGVLRLRSCASATPVRIRNLAAFSLALVGACAVSDRPREREGASASAIQGGSDDATHAFAVGITDNSSTCSGALIAPNLVLSARQDRKSVV